MDGGSTGKVKALTASGKAGGAAYALLGADRDFYGRITGAAAMLDDLSRIKIARTEAALQRYITAIALEGEMHLVKAYFHASPSILGIIATILNIAYKVWQVIKPIVTVIRLYFDLHIHDLLYATWKDYRHMVDDILRSVSDFSDSVGWGVDGVRHLIHAAQGGVNVLAGILGKDTDWVRFKWADKALKVTDQMSKVALFVNDNPAAALSIFHDEFNLDYTLEAGRWWTDVSGWIGETADRASTALTSLSWTIRDLTQLQVGMPQIVRDNIPEAIWDGLDRTDSFITNNLLPQLSQVSNTINRINATLDAHRARVDGIIDKLSHPGDVMLGVDDLPDYARQAQERLIDNVASREFERNNEQAILGMERDLDEFERIDRLLRSPTETPGFMEIESPKRGRVTGITVEEHETWMIGGYDDPR